MAFKKRKIEYNDDVFIIDCYPNSKEKMEILLVHLLPGNN
jgi:hypothetical protein